MAQHHRLQGLAALFLSAVATSLWILLLCSGALTAGDAVGYTPGAYSITTAGDAFSYSESYIEGDATPSNTSVSSGVVTSVFPMLGNTTTTSGGVAGSLAGTIASDGAMTITAGGAGTTATGQVVLSLEID